MIRKITYWFLPLVLAPLSLLATTPSLKQPQELPKEGDGYLVLYHYHHNELLEIRYRDAEGQYIPATLKKINHLMRSVDGKVSPMDVRLIEMIDRIQDHFGADTVEIISGYRSITYNKKLKSMGRKVLEESLHLRGIAADIHLDEIDEKSVYNFALSLKQGGVGYYPNNHFVHVDLGPVRTWAQPKRGRKLVGLSENNEGPCSLITDKNYYDHGKTKDIPIHVEGPPNLRRTGPEICGTFSEITFEHFRRGKWTALPEKSFDLPSNRSSFQLLLPQLPAGKFRLKAITRENPKPSLSNEFYLKTH